MPIDFIVRRESATSGGAEGRVDNGEGAIDTPEEAQQALTVFERQVVAADRDQYVIIDSQSRRYTYATIAGMARPAITATVTLPRIEGMRVRVPSVAVPPNIAFQDLVAELTLDPGGQQFRVTSDARLNVFTFRALPQGTTGLPPLRLALRVGSQASGEPNSSNLAFTLTSTTQASSIGGASTSGDLVFQVSGVRIGPSVSGEPTGTNGQIVISGNVLDLNGITATGNIPGVEVRVNPSTGALTLLAQAVPPPADIDRLPTNPTAWFQLNRAFWRDYQQTITSSQQLLHLPGQVADFPNADQLIPRGAGDVVFYLNGNTAAGVTPNQLTLTGDLTDAASVQALQRDLQGALVIRRMLPNPPPRPRDDGEPLRYSESQNPEGTLYFLPYRNAEGEIRPDGDLDNEMTRLIGADGPTAVKNGRIDMDALVDSLIANPALSGHVSRDTLDALIRSYLVAPNGTLRRNGHRGLITVASLLERDQERGLGALLQVTGGERRIASHEFVDDRFHAGISGGDGLDLQYRAVLPMTPERAEELLTTMPSERWDPWVTSSTRDGVIENVHLLGRDYELRRSRQMVGNIVLLHVTLRNRSTSEAYSRTIRLVPITEGRRTRTLVLMEEHRDQEGSEQGRPYPRLPITDDVTPINTDTLLAGALPTITSITGPNSDIAALSGDRFAFMMSNLVRLNRDPDLSRSTLLSSTVYRNDASRTNTVRIMDYLQLDATDAANPVLVISDEPRAQDIQNDLHTRLGIDPSVSAPWVVSRAHPVAGQSGNTRYIPLRELWQASLAPTAANPRGISFDSFRGLSTLLLNPPAPVQTSMEHLTATTARYWLVLRQMQLGLRDGPGSLIPASGNHPVNFFNFGHPSFHSIVSPGNTDPGDTIDSLVTFFVPTTNAALGRQMAEAGHHAENFGSYASFNFDPSGTALVPNDQVPDSDPTRRYIRTILIAGANVPYATSTPADVARFDGDVSAAVWRMELGVPNVSRGFYENFGLWMFIPAVDQAGQQLGYVGGRYSITNTTVFTDQSPMAQNLARDGVPPFVRAMVNEGYRLAGAAAGAPQYAAGRVTGLSDLPQ